MVGTRFSIGAQSLAKIPPSTDVVTFGRSAALTYASPADTFQKQSAQPDSGQGVPLANRLLSMLRYEKDNAKRRANAINLYNAITGQPPLLQKTLDMEKAQRSELEAVAKAVQEMPPAQKLDLIRETTGAKSPYSRVAEAILMNQKLPIRDALECIRPQKSDVNAGSVGFQTAAFGLLMLSSVVLPAAVIAKPELVGQMLALVKPEAVSRAIAAAAVAAL